VVLALAGAERVVVSLPADAFLVSPAVNLAGEPRDDLVVDGRLTGADVRPAPDSVSATALHARGALARALAMAGALDRLVALTVRHACEREQFGRPIARLQAVQQELAVLAGEAAAAGAAADAAVLADGTEHAGLAIAAAKIRAGRAAGTASAIAHQVHGAIGFTDEHSLHHLTRRLWAWRDEFGSEAEWSRRLGQVFAAAGPERVWSLLTA
jgi:acyl-CoA dehydrogenase